MRGRSRPGQGGSEGPREPVGCRPAAGAGCEDPTVQRTVAETLCGPGPLPKQPLPGCARGGSAAGRAGQGRDPEPKSVTQRAPLGSRALNPSAVANELIF